MNTNPLEIKEGQEVFFPDYRGNTLHGTWKGTVTIREREREYRYLIYSPANGQWYAVPARAMVLEPDMETYSQDMQDHWFVGCKSNLEDTAPNPKDIDWSEGVYIGPPPKPPKNLEKFMRAVNRDKYQRRRAMLLATFGLCSAIVAGFCFLDGRVFFGTIATLIFVAMFGLSYLAERR